VPDPSPADRAAFEAELRASFERGDLAAVARAVLETYGPEIYGLVAALLSNEEDAHEAWSVFAEDLWRGLPAFGWRASMRTWAYAVARHAAIRVREERRARRARNVGLSASPITAVAAEVRERTAPYLRTQAKSALEKLREGLEPDDQMLLVLRIDRGMSWEEIALVLGEETIEEAARKRQSAYLRKRFQLVKDRLREEAVALGLLDDER
jgi:RNA polymerase sigma-70 factor, ECF subfamily